MNQHEAVDLAELRRLVAAAYAGGLEERLRLWGTIYPLLDHILDRLETLEMHLAAIDAPETILYDDDHPNGQTPAMRALRQAVAERDMAARRAARLLERNTELSAQPHAALLAEMVEAEPTCANDFGDPAECVFCGGPQRSISSGWTVYHTNECLIVRARAALAPERAAQEPVPIVRYCALCGCPETSPFHEPNHVTDRCRDMVCLCHVPEHARMEAVAERDELIHTAGEIAYEKTHEMVRWRRRAQAAEQERDAALEAHAIEAKRSARLLERNTELRTTLAATVEREQGYRQILSTVRTQLAADRPAKYARELAGIEAALSVTAEQDKLRAYVQHKPRCAGVWHADYPERAVNCTCGLAALVRAMTEPQDRTPCRQPCDAHCSDDCPCGCCEAVEVARLRTTLAIYADPKTWHHSYKRKDLVFWGREGEYGYELARAALSATQEPQP